MIELILFSDHTKQQPQNEPVIIQKLEMKRLLEFNHAFSALLAGKE